MAQLILQDNKVRVLEINGKEYPVAERTGALEKRLIEEHDEKLLDFTEYERYKILISLILGEKAFDKLFPKGEEESLNKMAQVAFFAQQEFNADAKELEKQRMEAATETMFGDMDAVSAKFASLNKEMNNLMSKAELTAKAGRKKKK